jgi:polyphosphate kinase
MDFKNTPRNFINRELSWLEFNKRVLAQAKSENTPILEKLLQKCMNYLMS